MRDDRRHSEVGRPIRANNPEPLAQSSAEAAIHRVGDEVQLLSGQSRLIDCARDPRRLDLDRARCENRFAINSLTRLRQNSVTGSQVRVRLQVPTLRQLRRRTTAGRNRDQQQAKGSQGRLKPWPDVDCVAVRIFSVKLKSSHLMLHDPVRSHCRIDYVERDNR